MPQILICLLALLFSTSSPRARARVKP